MSNSEPDTGSSILTDTVPRKDVCGGLSENGLAVSRLILVSPLVNSWEGLGEVALLELCHCGDGIVVCCGTTVFYPVTCIIFNKTLIGQ